MQVCAGSNHSCSKLKRHDRRPVCMRQQHRTCITGPSRSSHCCGPSTCTQAQARAIFAPAPCPSPAQGMGQSAQRASVKMFEFFLMVQDGVRSAGAVPAAPHRRTCSSRWMPSTACVRAGGEAEEDSLLGA